MQVALVTDTFPPDLNGVSLTMDRLRRGLEARGHRVVVEFLTAASSSPSQDFTPTFIPSPGP